MFKTYSAQRMKTCSGASSGLMKNAMRKRNFITRFEQLCSFSTDNNLGWAQSMRCNNLISDFIKTLCPFWGMGIQYLLETFGVFIWRAVYILQRGHKTWWFLPRRCTVANFLQVLLLVTLVQYLQRDVVVKRWDFTHNVFEWGKWQSWTAPIYLQISLLKPFDVREM